MEFKSPQVVLEEVARIAQKRVNEAKGLVDGKQGSLRVLFYYSTFNEFLSRVGSLPEDSKYPFLFVNSTRARLTDTLPTGWVWDVPDVVLAAKSDVNWTRVQRDEFNFNPILTPVLTEVRNVMSLHGGVQVVTEGSVTAHYFYGDQGVDGYTRHRFNQPIDAYQISNMRIRITKNC